MDNIVGIHNEIKLDYTEIMFYVIKDECYLNI